MVGRPFSNSIDINALKVELTNEGRIPFFHHDINTFIVRTIRGASFLAAEGFLHGYSLFFS